MKPLLILTLLTAVIVAPASTKAQFADHRNRQVDSLERVLATDPPKGIDLAVLYNSLAWGWRHDAAKRIDYARRSIAEAQPLDSWTLVANGYMLIGLAYDGEMRYDSTLIYFNRAIAAAEQMRNFPKRFSEEAIDDRLASIYGNMGNMYNIQDSLHRAVEYYLRALKLFEKHGWRENEANAYYNIGEMYLSMENYSQAEENYHRTAEIAREIGDSLFMAFADFGLAVVESANGNYDRALQHALAAYDYFFSQPDEDTFQVAALNTLAEIYLEGLGDVDQAQEYVSRALKLIEEQEVWLIEQSDAKALMAEIHLRRGEWRAAEQTALEAMEILATDPTEQANLLPLYEVLVKAYSHLGNLPLSDEYLDKLVTLQSVRSTKHYQSAIREMETRYETEKKEARISTLEDEQRLIIWLGIVAGAVLVLALAVSLLLWRGALQKKRASEERIEAEKRIVASQALLDGELQERIRIARDLHDGLGSLLSATRLSLEDIRKRAILDADGQVRFSRSMGILDESIYEMRRVAHHLMPDALSRFGLKTALSDFCATIPSAEFVYYGTEGRFDQKLEEAIYRISHELINNALKHSGAGHILVQIVQEADRVALTVQDDGRGFDTSAATEGMGLANIRTRIASFGGVADMRSSAESGTEINVEFKI